MQRKIQLAAESKQTARRDYWHDQVKRWETSQLKQEAYCKEAGIKYSTFVYWRSMFLAESQTKPAESTFTPVKVVTTKPMLSDTPRVIQIKLVSGHSVYLPDTMKIESITALIQCLSVQHA